jgi:hypothetical protein
VFLILIGTICRINDNNACRVLIDVSSFSTFKNGRTVYEKGKTLELWVDSEEYSITDLEKDVVEHFSWSINQEPNFWFVGPHNGLTTRLGSDQQLLTLLRASKLVKIIMTVDRCEHVSFSQREDQSQVIDEENALQVVVTNEDNGLQVQVTNHSAGFDGQEWVEEQELGVTAAGPKRAEEEERDHYMDHGVDPDGDDPIGANEEWRYFKKQQKVPNAAGNGDNE